MILDTILMTKADMNTFLLIGMTKEMSSATISEYQGYVKTIVKHIDITQSTLRSEIKLRMDDSFKQIESLCKEVKDNHTQISK